MSTFVTCLMYKIFHIKLGWYSEVDLELLQNDDKG